MTGLNLILVVILCFFDINIKTKKGKIFFFAGLLLEMASVALFEIIIRWIANNLGMFEELTIQVKMLPVFALGEYLIISSTAFCLCAGWRGGPEYLMSINNTKTPGIIYEILLGTCLMVAIVLIAGLVAYYAKLSLGMGFAVGSYLGIVAAIIAITYGAYNELLEK
ncbi:MAG: hypothetical protein OEM02_03770 [Desulfobulbaceae bacterium]|nr:hypothetical protein [Desulfobulbaceae bacterium]